MIGPAGKEGDPKRFQHSGAFVGFFLIHFCLGDISCMIKFKRALIVKMLPISGLKTAVSEWGWVQSLFYFLDSKDL